MMAIDKTRHCESTPTMTTRNSRHISPSQTMTLPSKKHSTHYERLRAAEAALTVSSREARDASPSDRGGSNSSSVSSEGSKLSASRFYRNLHAKYNEGQVHKNSDQAPPQKAPQKATASNNLTIAQNLRKLSQSIAHPTHSASLTASNENKAPSNTNNKSSSPSTTKSPNSPSQNEAYEIEASSRWLKSTLTTLTLTSNNVKRTSSAVTEALTKYKSAQSEYNTAKTELEQARVEAERALRQHKDAKADRDEAERRLEEAKVRWERVRKDADDLLRLHGYSRDDGCEKGDGREGEGEQADRREEEGERSDKREDKAREEHVGPKAEEEKREVNHFTFDEDDASRSSNKKAETRVTSENEKAARNSFHNGTLSRGEYQQIQTQASAAPSDSNCSHDTSEVNHNQTKAKQKYDMPDLTPLLSNVSSETTEHAVEKEKGRIESSKKVPSPSAPTERIPTAEMPNKPSNTIKIPHAVSIEEQPPNTPTPQQITVRGSGTPEVNGIYTKLYGSFDNCPMYGKIGTWEGKEKPFRIFRWCDKWFISIPGKKFYKANSMDALPPTDGWRASSKRGGVKPAPTIVYGD